MIWKSRAALAGNSVSHNKKYLLYKIGYTPSCL
nr:MAG TPA: hypothetical protein [Caudoviricetes sp.]